MRALRPAYRLAALFLLSFAGLTCRDTAGPAGTGRVAPTNAALAFSSVLREDSGDPIIPIRQARVRLFRLPGQIPEVAAIDTVLPFSESDSARVVTLGITLTMASERFGIELALLDERAQVAYLARDTVIAYTSGPPPTPRPLTLRYAGPDTAVARIALAPTDTVLAIGDVLPLRPAAFLRDGASTGARFGFAVHGTSAITVDRSGTLRASGPVPPGAAWVVARIATGLVDSVGIAAIVPARSIALTPSSARVLAGKMMTLSAVAHDSAGAPIVGRAVAWNSSDPDVADVSNGGIVSGLRAGAALITASSERASASAMVTVLPGGIARVVPSTDLLVIGVGQTATISAVARDAADDEMPGLAARWTIANSSLAVVSPGTSATATDVAVRGLAQGLTSLTVTVDTVEATIGVQVRQIPPARVTIAPRTASLLVGGSVALSAVAYDADGAVLAGAPITWQSRGPTIASVDAGGVVRALAVGHASLVASAGGVADTISVYVAPATTLSVTRVSTVFGAHGEIATYAVAITDQSGPVANATPSWQLSGSATLLETVDLTARVLLVPEAEATLTVSYGGASVSVALVGASLTTPQTSYH
jgi:uncharacterized protein YjdB